MADCSRCFTKLKEKVEILSGLCSDCDAKELHKCRFGLRNQFGRGKTSKRNQDDLRYSEKRSDPQEIEKRMAKIAKKGKTKDVLQRDFSPFGLKGSRVG